MKKTSFYLTMATMIITAFSLWFIQRPVTPKQTTWDDVVAESKTGGYRIITTEELIRRYRENPSEMLLVDTRQEWEYRTGHINGALNFPMEPSSWARWRKAGDLKTFLGPDKNRHIVFY